MDNGSLKFYFAPMWPSLIINIGPQSTCHLVHKRTLSKTLLYYGLTFRVAEVTEVALECPESKVHQELMDHGEHEDKLEIQDQL